MAFVNAARRYDPEAARVAPTWTPAASRACSTMAPPQAAERRAALSEPPTRRVLPCGPRTCAARCGGLPAFSRCAPAGSTACPSPLRVECALELRGMHNVSNACAAAAVGFAAGMEAAQVAAALSGAEPEAGRQEVIAAPRRLHRHQRRLQCEPRFHARVAFHVRRAATSPERASRCSATWASSASFAPRPSRGSGRLRRRACGLDRLVCVGRACPGHCRRRRKAGMPDRSHRACVADGAAALADVRERTSPRGRRRGAREGLAFHGS